MKKQINFFLVGISTLSFAINKLQGPFYDTNTDYNIYLSKKITLITKNNLNKELFTSNDPIFNQYPHLYMYDEKTEYIIAYADDSKSQLYQAARYFLCMFEEGIHHPYFYIVKSKLDSLSSSEYKLNKLDQKVKNACLSLQNKGILPNGPWDIIDQAVKANDPELAKNQLYVRPQDMTETTALEKVTNELNLGKEIYFIKLDTLITTKNNITLSRRNSELFIANEKKCEKFQDMLAQYLERKIKSISSNTQDSENKKTTPVTTKINQSNLDLLNKSIILTVLAIKEDQFDNDAFLWGVAYDKGTKEKFHWVLDLEDDISILLSDEF